MLGALIMDYIIYMVTRFAFMGLFVWLVGAGIYHIAPGFLVLWFIFGIPAAVKTLFIIEDYLQGV